MRGVRHREGLVRAYGWSTDDPERAVVFAVGPHCTAIQHALNVLNDAPRLLEPCERPEPASIHRSPPAMGLPAGRRDGTPEAGDIRSRPPVRTLARGALARLRARSPRTVPVPGFQTVAQAEENAGAMAKGPPTPGHLAEIGRVLGR